MECNKDEAIRAKEVSESKMEKNDFEGARKIALKAQKLYPALHNIAQLICVCDVHCSAQKRIMSTDKDWYGILQMESLADEATIKKQYRKLALLLHPDKNQLPGAEAAFKSVCEAYSVLTDAAKKTNYDLKIRNAGKSALVRPPHMKASSNSNKDTNGVWPFGNLNQHPTSSSSSVNVGVFWTSCPYCQTGFQYSREYLKKPMSCHSCKKPFIGYERSAPAGGVPSGPGPSQPGVHMPSEPQPTGFQQKVVRNQGNSKMGGRNGQGSSAPHAGPQGVSSTKAAPQKTSAPVESSSKGARNRKEAGKVNGVASYGEPVDLKRTSKGAGKRKEAEKVNGGSSNGEPVDLRSTSKGAGKRKEAEKVNGDASNGEPVDLKNKSRKKARVPVEESSESFVTSSDSDLDDETNGGNSGAGHIHIQRRSSRAKQNIQYNETHPAMGCGSAGPLEVESDVDPDSDSEDNLDENRLECPDPEFHDFDKERDANNFSVDQIWACYDDFDSMPRFYAKVKKATASPFEVKFRWLDPAPKDKDHKKWVNEGLPVGCGTYKLGKAGDSSVLDTFSHKMMPFKQDKKNAPLTIYPNKGEIWALYKDWDINWSSNPENHNVFKYEIVEVLSDFVANVGVKVGYLDKVAGFVSLFRRASLSESNTFLVGSKEVLKFAHRIPSFRMTGAEKEGVPVGSFELDPASLPLDPDFLHFPFKSKMEGGSNKGGRS